MEKENAVKEEELRLHREQEIRELETRPYLSSEDQDRLRKLKLDQEFDRRVQEATARSMEDDDDITQRAAVSRRKLITITSTYHSVCSQSIS